MIEITTPAFVISFLGRSNGSGENLTADHKVWFTGRTSVPIPTQVCKTTQRWEGKTLRRKPLHSEIICIMIWWHSDYTFQERKAESSVFEVPRP